jgi:hypothetical protein
MTMVKVIQVPVKNALKKIKIYIYIHVYIHTHINTCMYMCMYIYICVYTRAHAPKFTSC